MELADNIGIALGLVSLGTLGFILYFLNKMFQQFLKRWSVPKHMFQEQDNKDLKGLVMSLSLEQRIRLLQILVGSDCVVSLGVMEDGLQILSCGVPSNMEKE